MAVPCEPSVRPVGLLVDTVSFETVETVKRPSSCTSNCTRAGASSSSPVTLPTFVEGVPFEPLESAGRPSSCPASFTRAGASSSCPVRLPRARQADIHQDEHNPSGGTSRGHSKDGTSVAVKPVVTLSNTLAISTRDRLLRPSINCEASPGRRNERSPGFQASDHQADLGWKAHPPCLEVANVHHASRQRVVVEPVELQ